MTGFEPALNGISVRCHYRLGYTCVKEREYMRRESNPHRTASKAAATTYVGLRMHEREGGAHDRIRTCTER